MGLLALGLFLLLLGVGLALTPMAAFAPILAWAGWIAMVVGVILAVVHLAVGRRRYSRRGGRGA
ncbi:MAG TPA: hypothetical protein VM370_10775 [Candidatus Thermoplasmatota archaeon]|nr:hypothetical protein [Candidatus Thermoplasmatota archaeon]